MEKRIGKVNSKRSALTKKLADLRNGRDEMNLCELPFATLSTRSGSRNIMQFSYEDIDQDLNQVVQRTLTVKGDPEFGLPTASDEEIYLAGVKYTRDYNGCSNPLVHFCRSEYLELLGWTKKDADYDRLLKGMHRLVGVRLSFSKSWRDNRNKQWRDQGAFGIFDSFEFRDARKVGKGQRFEEVSSWFRWNGVLFESFDAGYLKRIDYGLVRRLRPTARRLYRYLDKHFHPPRKTAIVIAVDRLAHTHIGVSKNIAMDKVLKRYLGPAAEELEQAGYLAVLPPADRFIKNKGQSIWQAKFTLNHSWDRGKVGSRDTTHVERALRERGVTENTARRVARNKARKLVQEAIVAMDENRARGVSIRDPDKWVDSAIARGFKAVDCTNASFRPERKLFVSDRLRERIARGNSA